jgi:hypothetical protein
MSLNLELRFDPDPPNAGPGNVLYGDVSLQSGTTVNEYEIDVTFNHPDGSITTDRRPCTSIDPHSHKTHTLLENFDASAPGTYRFEIVLLIDQNIVATGHKSITIT